MFLLYLKLYHYLQRLKLLVLQLFPPHQIHLPHQKIILEKLYLHHLNYLDLEYLHPLLYMRDLQDYYHHLHQILRL